MKIQLFTLKKVTTFVAIFSLLTMYFVNTTTAFAGAYTARKVLQTNTAPSATAVTYTFTFTVADTATVYNHVNITYSVNADGTGGLPTSMNGGTAGSTSLAGTTPSFTWNTPVNSNKLSWAAGSAQTAGSKAITLTNVTNPSTTAVFYAKIASYSSADESALIDSGVVASATVPVVTVSGTQLESLTAAVTAKTSGTICTDTSSAKSVIAGTTATAINFGTFNGTTQINAGHTLTMGSNATSGITAKLVEDHVLTGPTTIADFGGATDNVAGTQWVNNSSTGFGVCAFGGDGNTGAAGVNFANGTKWKGLTSAQTIAATTGPSNNTGTDIAFTVGVAANLQAGVYSNQLTYNILANY